MEFSRQDYWSGSPFSSPGDLTHLGIKPESPAFWADSLPGDLPDPGIELQSRALQADFSPSEPPGEG